MDELIEGLLALSRLTASGMDIQEVDLSTIADAILRDLHRSEPNRRVGWHIDPGLRARADRRLMHAALHNLLENAWKFTSHRDVAEISFGRGEQKGLSAYYVRDNGVGFDPGQAASLFTAFQRLHPGDEYGRLGIGLATVERIIHRHGGRIWAEAAPDKGATFYFTLPESQDEN
jgi:light-regulated signal transduction histidine kinase (bacteriophytochrome)